MTDQPEEHPRRFPTICKRLWDKAKKIGKGNASEGVREALEKYKLKQEKE